MPRFDLPPPLSPPPISLIESPVGAEIAEKRKGGLRTMIVPPHLGFPEGIPGRIPVDATIVYEVELLAIGEPVDDEP